MSDLHNPLLPLAHFVGRIIRGEPFSISRWGDGEWYAVLGRSGRNCDRHEFFPQMGEELRQVLRSKPPYALGLQPFALQNIPGEQAIREWLDKEGLELPWINADVFHIPNHRKCLAPLVEALRRRPLVMVGPERLRSLYHYLRFAVFIPVPDQDCYLAKNRIVREIREALSRLSDLPVVSFSASMAANVMIHELYEEWGDKSFLLDLGSLWDPYTGAVTRGEYHRDILDHCLTVSGSKDLQEVVGAKAKPRRIVRLPMRPTSKAAKPKARYFPHPRRYP